VGTEITELVDNLFVVDMRPTEAIHEYVLLTLRFETVYRAVFENRLVRHFIRLIPSLNELTLLGKIWYHEREMVGGAPRFDLIIVDAPATGHALSLLRAPAAVEATVPQGTMRDTCTKIRDLLGDHARTALHIVTTPEEMPVNEAVDLERAAADLLGIRVGTTFINQAHELLPAEALTELAPLATEPEHALALDILRIRQSRVAAGEAHLQRLPAHLLRDAVRLPFVPRPRFDHQGLLPLMDLLERARIVP